MIGYDKENDKLLKKVTSLGEPELRNLIMNLFDRKGILVEYTHGGWEHGADIILELETADDALRRGQIFLFQIKAGNIEMKDWQGILCGQLTELYCRPITLPNINETLSLRIVLITSGELTQAVNEEITHWNSKLPIPIEVFNGRRLTKFLQQEGYTIKDLSRLVKPRTRPIEKIRMDNKVRRLDQVR